MNHSTLELDLRRLGWAFATTYCFIAILLSGIFLYLNHAHHTRLANSYALASRHSLLVRDLRLAVAALAPAVKAGFLSVAIRSPEGDLLVGIPNNTSTEAQQRPFTITIVESIHSEVSAADKGSIASLEFSYSVRSPIVMSLLGSALLFVLFSTLFIRAKRHLEERHNLFVKERELEVAQNLARQVAHDIRSPLSALNVVVSSLGNLPDAERLLIKNASQRINEIAIALIKKSHIQAGAQLSAAQLDGASIYSPAKESVPIAPLIESLMNEKRVQFRHRTGLDILADISKGTGLEVRIDRIELSRAISNLVNNSIEAIETAGQVVVSLRSYPKECAIIISDNGKGIPPDVLCQLGKPGITHGKEQSDSGAGLGVHHATTTVEMAGGRFQIQSKVNEGTIVTLVLPRS